MATEPQQLRPVIWVLKGLRAGDTAQAMALALRLGGRVEAKQLTFNASHAVPNWLTGGRISHLRPEARSMLHVPWPDLVVATGRRTAAVAVWIKAQSGGTTRLVQIGRPRMALSAFDLVLTTPQYGIPGADNVIELKLPLALPKAVSADALLAARSLWQDLPRPWTLAAIGGAKFPLRLGNAELSAYGQGLSRQVARDGGSVILLDSPRSPAGALAQVASQLAVPHWQWLRGVGDNPYQAALQLCDRHVVTSDSVSMVTEMILSGKAVQIFRLPRVALAPRWQARSGVLAALAAHGLFHPPRDVDGFMQELLKAGLVGDLASGTQAAPVAGEQAAFDNVLARVRALMSG